MGLGTGPSILRKPNSTFGGNSGMDTLWEKNKFGSDDEVIAIVVRPFAW